MKCKICDEELILPVITCTCCHNNLKLYDDGLIEYMTHLYAITQNKINKYSENRYDDNYKIKAIKNTKLEVLNEILMELTIGLKEYTSVDISKIDIPDIHEIMPRMCDLDHSKICNGCMDC